MGLDVLRIMF